MLDDLEVEEVGASQLKTKVHIAYIVHIGIDYRLQKLSNIAPPMFVDLGLELDHYLPTVWNTLLILFYSGMSTVPSALVCIAWPATTSPYQVCTIVQLPVFLHSSNWILKHYLCIQE